MDYILYQEKKIAYTLSGQGQPLVLLHGFCEDSRVWEDFIPLLRDVQIIRIDLPGFGQSNFMDNHSIAEMAEGVKAVLDHLNIKKGILLGHSMGGYVSLAFAKKYPSWLQGMGLIHSHPYADTETGKQDRDKSIRFIQHYNHVLYTKQLVPKLFSHQFAMDHNFLINKLIHQTIAYRPEAIIKNLEAMRDRPDASSTLGQLACPVLFVIGKKDEVIPLEKSLEQSYLPAVVLIQMLPKVGHMGMYEAPKKMAKMINQFTDFCQNFALQETTSATSINHP